MCSRCVGRDVLARCVGAPSPPCAPPQHLHDPVVVLVRLAHRLLRQALLDDARGQRHAVEERARVLLRRAPAARRHQQRASAPLRAIRAPRGGAEGGQRRLTPGGGSAAARGQRAARGCVELHPAFAGEVGPGRLSRLGDGRAARGCVAGRGRGGEAAGGQSGGRTLTGRSGPLSADYLAVILPAAPATPGPSPAASGLLRTVP
jgi:hypothetical protein